MGKGTVAKGRRYFYAPPSFSMEVVPGRVTNSTRLGTLPLVGRHYHSDETIHIG